MQCGGPSYALDICYKHIYVHYSASYTIIIYDSEFCTIFHCVYDSKTT